MLHEPFDSLSVYIGQQFIFRVTLQKMLPGNVSIYKTTHSYHNKELFLAITYIFNRSSIETPDKRGSINFSIRFGSDVGSGFDMMCIKWFSIFAIILLITLLYCSLSSAARTANVNILIFLKKSCNANHSREQKFQLMFSGET